MATKTQLGFGKVAAQNEKAQQSKTKRAAAAQKYDELKQKGFPEFNIYIRVQGEENWIPAGSMAVERSNKINAALFQQEEELQKGVLRLYPRLSQHQSRLEYGYRLKEFHDEPITIAVRPSSNFWQSTVNQIKQRFTKF